MPTMTTPSNRAEDSLKRLYKILNIEGEQSVLQGPWNIPLSGKINAIADGAGISSPLYHINEFWSPPTSEDNGCSERNINAILNKNFRLSAFDSDHCICPQLTNSRATQVPN